MRSHGERYGPHAVAGAARRRAAAAAAATRRPRRAPARPGAAARVRPVVRHGVRAAAVVAAGVPRARRGPAEGGAAGRRARRADLAGARRGLAAPRARRDRGRWCVGCRAARPRRVGVAASGHRDALRVERVRRRAAGARSMGAARRVRRAALGARRRAGGAPGPAGATARLLLLVGLSSLVPTGGLLVAGVAVPVAAGPGTRAGRARRVAVVVGALLLQAPWVVPSVLHPAVGASDPDGAAVFALRPEGPWGALGDRPRDRRGVERRRRAGARGRPSSRRWEPWSSSCWHRRVAAGRTAAGPVRTCVAGAAPAWPA